MSKLGLSLCIKLLAESNLEVLQQTGVNSEMLKGTDKKLFSAITKHFRAYGKMPEWETVLEDVDIEQDALPKAKEPARYYADAILKLATLNSQREWMHKQAEALKNQDPAAFLECAKGAIREATEKFHLGGGTLIDLTKNGPERFADYEALKGLQDGVLGIRSPWSVLDETTQGWKAGDLISVVARLGIGKTWWAILNADAAHAQGAHVGFVSMEMNAKAIARRRDAIRFKLPYEDFKKGQLDSETEERYKIALHEQGSPDESRWLVSTDRVDAIEDVDMFVEETGVNFLLVDGAYLIQDAKARNDWERVTKVVRSMKKLVRRRQIPAMLMMQLRKSVKTGQTTAGSEDIAFTDAVGQDSDIVVVQLRGPDEEQRGEMIHELIKNRDGPRLTFKSAWDFTTMDFQVLEGELPDRDDRPEKGKKGKKRAPDEDIPF